MPTRLDKLKEKQADLSKRIARLQARESAARRKLDERRKIILGGWLIKHRPDLVKHIADNLERDQDRRAFADWDASAAATEE